MGRDKQRGRDGVMARGTEKEKPESTQRWEASGLCGGFSL